MASDERTLEDFEGSTPDRHPDDAGAATSGAATLDAATLDAAALDAVTLDATTPGATASGTTPSDDPNLGRRIGPYRVERLIARGGMGAVYLAVRQDDYQHRVALKLVHPELQTAEVLRRFAVERQILANLQRPHIAGILDGGTTDDALPFFVMEEALRTRLASLGNLVGLLLGVVVGLQTLQRRHPAVLDPGQVGDVALPGGQVVEPELAQMGVAAGPG